MQPSDRLIVRFSFACLALSLVAALLPFAFPDSLWQDSVAEPVPVEPVFIAGEQSGSGLEQPAEACTPASLICGSVH